MGFRKDSYATIWSIEPVSETLTRGRLSVSRKNRQTNEYETDFSGFVSFIGTICAKKAAGLKERDRIRLGDIDVSTKFEKEKNVTYTNYKIFSFEIPDDGEQSESDKAETEVGDGEVDDSNLPF